MLAKKSLPGSSSAPTPDDNTVFKQYFHARIIEFITSESRLFNMEKNRTWSEFLIKFPEYFHKHNMNPLRVKQEFLEKILPAIFTYFLYEDQRKYFHLLEYYPKKLTKTEEGYILETPEKNILKESHDEFIENMKEQGNLTVVDSLNDDNNLNTATVIVPKNFSKITSPSPVVHAWISAVLSTDEELDRMTILPVSEIRKRYKEVKKIYNNTGTKGGFLNYDKVFKKLEKHKRFKKTLQRKFSSMVLEKLQHKKEQTKLKNLSPYSHFLTPAKRSQRRRSLL